MLMTPKWKEQFFPPGGEQPPAECKLFLAEKPLMQGIVGFRMHQGIMAVARVPLLPEFESASLPAPHLVVALDGLAHAENVGVVVRNCAAFGVHAILVGENSCSPYLRRAVRNSMGAAFTVPVFHVPSLRQSLLQLRERNGTRLIAADAHAQQSIYSTDLQGNVCIILGNEDAGIGSDVLALKPERLVIPMQKNTDSLNVACANAVILSEAVRQRAYYR
jgi:tRNA G18 (ribose-2'-O)-methylase SpoU